LVDHPSAALLIRVWLEDAGELRARLLTLGDVSAGRPAEEVTVAVASSVTGVLDAVRVWLDDFTRQATGLVDGDE
jgi:cell division inhibitor SulA